MKFTLGWLCDHLETDADLETIADKLTAIGLEVEKIEDAAADLAPFTVAEVIEARGHPNADKLSLCTVRAVQGTFEVVCGAPNARTGMKGVFAPVGTTIPGTGMILKPVTIRGVESNGMLCSEMEMGLSDEHEGIIELPADAEFGAPFARVLGLDDPVIEVAITPSRQDCLGVRGIARDLAAAGLGVLKPDVRDAVPGRFESATGVRLDFAAAEADACPLFVGRTIRGITNGASPDWMRRRLKAIGLRPISALVDITNYLTYDRGRPLHVYDIARLSGDIIVRLGRDGEKLEALDGNSYDIDDSHCVIADESRVLGLGGVIGGDHSGCTEATTDVFVEAALFDPLRNAATGRRLSIESDARFRFERGVDPEYTIPGMEAATRLILELCGGEPSELVIAGRVPEWQRTIELRPGRVAALGGLDVPAGESERILGQLGFTVETSGDVLHVSPPSWRSDIEGEADLVEEVVRIKGYDSIPSVAMVNEDAVARPILTPIQKRVRIARRILAGRGMVETVTWSFMSSRFDKLFGGGNPALWLENPISSELDVMRPSLVPNLIAATGRNLDRGFENSALFEIGPQYSDATPAGQSSVAAGVRRGANRERHWSGKPRVVDAIDAKGDALALLAACGIAVDKVQIAAEAPAWYHPGRSAVIRLGPKTVLACFGELHPGVLDSLDVRGPMVGFEVFLEAIPVPRRPSRARPPLDAPDLPSVQRDFAFVVPRAVAAGDIVRAAAGADKSIITNVSIFDVYEGEGIGDGEKSVAVAVTLQPRVKTLTDAEIEAVCDRVAASVTKATGAVLRK